MPEVQIPFLKGVHEEADSKLLPQGSLVRAENVRFQKEGRVVSRNGYAFVDGSPTDVTCVASANYAAARTLHFATRDVGAGQPAKWWQRKPGGTYTDPAFASCLSSIEAPKRTVATPTLRYSCIASDMTYVVGYLFVVYNDFDAVNATDGGLFFSVYERQTMQIVASGPIVDFGVAASSYFNPKCIAQGDDVYVFYVKDDEILMWKFESSTLTGASVTLSPALTTAAPVTGHHQSLDICAFDSDEIAVCTELTITGTSNGISVYRVTQAGATSLAFSSVSYGAEPKHVGIAPVSPSSTTFGVACITDGNTLWGSFTSAGVVVTPVTTIDASGDVLGAPCLSSNAQYGNVLAWGRSGSPSGRMGVCTFTGGAIDDELYVPSLWPVCKPFTSGELGTFVWCVDETHDPSGELSGGYGTYRLVDVGNLSLVDIPAGGAISEAVCAQEEALAGNWYYGEQFDQRRGSVSLDETAENGQAVSTHITALPTLVGAATTAGRVDFVEFRSGEWVDRLQPARLNGQLFLSGPRLREFDGSQLYESGLFQGPKEFTAEAANDVDSELPVGDYQYCAIFKWIDAGGRIHRSQVSLPKTVSIGEGQGGEITIAAPPFSDRTANGTTTIFVEVYRTLLDGSVFHLLNPDERFVYSPDLFTPITVLDHRLDADIEGNEEVYIGNGEVLDNEEPPPCKYVWAGENRLLMGGLEDPSMYQFSKKSRPGLAIAFSSDEAFKGTIEGDVTGVAQLDGTWLVGSRDAIWTIFGDGPDDTGAGSFSPPRRLPSDTGFVSQRSIVEVPQGLMFMGQGAKLYLIPRGGGAPTWVGAPVQDTFDEYPFVTCAAFLPEEHVAIFACWRFDDGDVDGDGRILVWDTDFQEWITDKPFLLEDAETRLFRSVAVWDGKPLFDGHIIGTDAWTDDVDGASPTHITCTVESGDIRFFGPSGTGRCRRMTLLGASQSDFVNVNVSVSRDSGSTYDSPSGSFVSPFDDHLQYDLPYVRDASFRARIIATSCDEEGALTPGEGVVLNAMSFEVFPERGLKRLAASKRA